MKTWIKNGAAWLFLIFSVSSTAFAGPGKGPIMWNLEAALKTGEEYLTKNPNYVLELSRHLLRQGEISVEVKIHKEMDERHNQNQKKQLLQALSDSLSGWTELIRLQEGDEHLPRFVISQDQTEQNTIHLGTPRVPVMHVSIVKDLEGNILGNMTVPQNPNGARMKVQTHYTDRQLFFRQTKRLWYKDFRQLFMHELGHFLGLDHSAGVKNEKKEMNLMTAFDFGGRRISEPSSTELDALIEFRKRVIALKNRALDAGARGD